MAAASSNAWLGLDFETGNYRLCIDSVDDKRRALFRVEYRNNGSSFKNLVTGKMEKRSNGGNIEDENISKDSNIM